MRHPAGWRRGRGILVIVMVVVSGEAAHSDRQRCSLVTELHLFCGYYSLSIAKKQIISYYPSIFIFLQTAQAK